MNTSYPNAPGPVRSPWLGGGGGQKTIDASELIMGTLADARLSPNVPLWSVLQPILDTIGDASGLNRGAVAPSLVSGNYPGITKVGTLTNLVVASPDTQDSYMAFGFGSGARWAIRRNVGTDMLEFVSANNAGAPIGTPLKIARATGVMTLEQRPNVNGVNIALVSDILAADLSNLNASNLTSGTVPSARMTGGYSGITALGTLSALTLSTADPVNTEIILQGGGVNRWAVRRNPNQDTFELGTYDNAGNAATVPLSIARGSGVATFLARPKVGATGVALLTDIPTFTPPTDNSWLHLPLRVDGDPTTQYIGFGTVSGNTQPKLKLDASGYLQWFGAGGAWMVDMSAQAINLGAPFGIWNGLQVNGALNADWVKANYLIGNGSYITSIPASAISGSIPATQLTGTIQGAQIPSTLAPKTYVDSAVGNASSLTTGTVGSALLSGAYTGITSVGTLSALAVTGALTAGTLSGDGASVTNLAAGNVATGTMAIARGGTGLGTAPGALKVLLGQAGGTYALRTLTAGANVTLTEDGTAGTLTIAASGGGGGGSTTDASLLTSGTLASARISGQYSGITGVGVLSASFTDIGSLGNTAGQAGAIRFKEAGNFRWALLNDNANAKFKLAIMSDAGNLDYIPIAVDRTTHVTDFLVRPTVAGANIALSSEITAPDLSNLNASNLTSGTAPIAHGGTGVTTAPSGLQVLLGQTGGTYALRTLTAGTGLTLTEDSTGGTLTIASSGGGGGTDASALTTGTLPSGRLTGSYTGISAIGTQLSSVTIGNGVASGPALIINGPGSSTRQFSFQTAGSPRWIFRTNGTAETGSAAGSDFEVVSRSDDGTQRAIVLSIARSSGIATFSGAVYSSGAIGGATTTLVDGTFPAVNAALGNYHELTVVSTTQTRTFQAPDNGTTGQVIHICIRNSSGATMGTSSFNVAYKMPGTYGNPANGKARIYSFIKQSSGNWQCFNDSGDMTT